MEKKIAFTILLALSLLTNHCLAQDKKQELSGKIIGTWQFSNYWNPGGPVYAEYVADTCQNLTTYTFKEDGTALVQSKDVTKCKTAPQKMYWSIISLHDALGNQRYAIRMTEEKIAERESYDANTWNDVILMIVSLKKKTIRWVEKPQYSPAGLEKQSVYDK